MVGIVFRPAGMHTLFNLPLGELTDERLNIAEILRGGEIRILQDKIIEAQNTTERIGLLTQFLTIQLMKNEYRFDAVDFTANQIVDAKGIINYGVFKGMNSIKERIRSNLKANPNKTYNAQVERTNWLIKKLSLDWAWVNYNQKTSNVKGEIFVSYETRLMNKVNGKWKLAVINALWDYKNVLNKQ